MAPHSQQETRVLQYQQVVIAMAGLLRAFGWTVPEDGDTSLQAMATRAGQIKTFLAQAGGEKVRSIAGDRRRALGDLVHDLDLDATDIEPGHPLPRARSLRPATEAQVSELIPLATALAQAAGVNPEDEEGGVA